VSDRLTRRSILAESLASSTAVSAAWGTSPLPTSVPSVSTLPAGEKIAVGFIGLGGIGTGMPDRFLKHLDTDVVAVCDVYAPRIYRVRHFPVRCLGQSSIGR
jgi:hypothetical protein